MIRLHSVVAMCCIFLAICAKWHGYPSYLFWLGALTNYLYVVYLTTKEQEK